MESTPKKASERSTLNGTSKDGTINMRVEIGQDSTRAKKITWVKLLFTCIMIGVTLFLAHKLIYFIQIGPKKKKDDALKLCKIKMGKNAKMRHGKCVCPEGTVPRLLSQPGKTGQTYECVPGVACDGTHEVFPSSDVPSNNEWPNKKYYESCGCTEDYIWNNTTKKCDGKIPCIQKNKSIPFDEQSVSILPYEFREPSECKGEFTMLEGAYDKSTMQLANTGNAAVIECQSVSKNADRLGCFNGITWDEKDQKYKCICDKCASGSSEMTKNESGVLSCCEATDTDICTAKLPPSVKSNECLNTCAVNPVNPTQKRCITIDNVPSNGSKVPRSSHSVCAVTDFPLSALQGKTKCPSGWQKTSGPNSDKNEWCTKVNQEENVLKKVKDACTRTKGTFKQTADAHGKDIYSCQCSQGDYFNPAIASNPRNTNSGCSSEIDTRNMGCVPYTCADNQTFELVLNSECQLASLCIDPPPPPCHDHHCDHGTPYQATDGSCICLCSNGYRGEQCQQKNGIYCETNPQEYGHWDQGTDCDRNREKSVCERFNMCRWNEMPRYVANNSQKGYSFEPGSCAKCNDTWPCIQGKTASQCKTGWVNGSS